ncbi:transcriptional regulator [Streptomyces sp. TP-A0356]|uniref:winged helix-turn-helix domain-containing protein n=1 Tax=Streptomyces sp. TP-A0356 TaxID=1359208 RepID=UPI0006E2E0C0|nr:transcriptional regulator [Streptomyces sp. TP-A0356]
MSSDASPPALDPLIQHPTRLAIMAFLSGCAEAEFSAVRDGCQVSDSALSKVISALESASYVTVRKGYVGKRPRTWLSLSDEGRTALAGHLAALQRIAADAAALGSTLGTSS